MNDTANFSEPVSAAADPPAVDYGTLTSPPTLCRALNSGHIMILNAERQSAWASNVGNALIPSMGLAREIMAHHGYRIGVDAPDGFYAVLPIPGVVAADTLSTPGMTLGPPVGGVHPLAAPYAPVDLYSALADPVQPSVAVPGWLGMPLNAEPAPNPLPPGARAFVPLVAQALPCAEPGDQIDTNRLHLGWAVWRWLLAHRAQLAPLFAPPAAPTAPAPAAPLAEKAPDTKARLAEERAAKRAAKQAAAKAPPKPEPKKPARAAKAPPKTATRSTRKR